MALVLKSFEFRRERERVWQELEELVAQVERRGVRSLTARELSRLPVLYRSTVASLSVARAISLDRNVIEYLEHLSARGYLAVYGTRRHLRESVADFFGHRFPAAVRQFRWQLAASYLIMALGVVAGLLITLRDPDRFYSFVSAEMAQGRGPSSSTAELREVLYASKDMRELLAAFALFLFTHNARIGLMAFALGFAAGVPVVILLFVNGLTLGAFAALYRSRGMTLEFWAWVLPHGVTELTAVALCGAGGLVLAQSLSFPGRSERLRNLAVRGREAGQIALGAVALFLVAGLIEGIFRQLVHSVPIRLAVAGTSAALWITYFAWKGRRSPLGRP
jgi:uncharacterized membrane protein SpoIIM required for sporulation